MPLVKTRGVASAQGFGEFAQATVANYIEDVFSTYLYTGTNAALTITNNIDLSTKGGLVWCKARTGGTVDHALSDTARGRASYLISNSANAAGTVGVGDNITSFNSNGFSLGTDAGTNFNSSGDKMASWTFRKQPKFFDVVTYTGTGSNTTIAHSLGSVPGSIIVKRTDITAAWAVYHRSLANTQYLVLNTTAAAATGATRWNSTTPTSAVFSVGTDATVNASGGTYVAYLFAHDAGGFGLTGTDNVISCGSYTGVGSTQQDITLGYEPQWLMIKRTDTTDSWIMVDNMRGFFQTADNALEANSSNAEAAGVSVSGAMQPTATGFHLYNANSAVNASGGTYIYIACRRGPMKVPTLGTSVFGLSARTGTGANATVTGGQTDDAVIIKNRGSAVGDLFASRLTGTRYVETSDSAAEVAAGATILQTNPWDVMDGVKVGTTSTITNASANTYINYLFRRAPSFFDEVCYTGTSVVTNFSHNLASVPELMIIKSRSDVRNWAVYVASGGPTKFLNLNFSNALQTSSTYWNDTAPTSTIFTLGAVNTNVNFSGETYVAYLFATCAGVSKVGSYTGNGTTQTINCGFGAGGVRFVLIKRTDSLGDWYVYDTARGMTVLTDPYLLLNSTAAEVATLGSVTTVSTGFALDSAILADINVSAGTYTFLAIA